MFRSAGLQSNQAIVQFDEAVHNLRREKIFLEADLKAGKLLALNLLGALGTLLLTMRYAPPCCVCLPPTDELQVLLYNEELALLQNFEAKDAALSIKMNKAQSEKAEVVGAISDCQTRLKAKKKVNAALHTYAPWIFMRLTEDNNTWLHTTRN